VDDHLLLGAINARGEAFEGGLDGKERPRVSVYGR